MHAEAANAAANPTRWPNYREGDFVIRNYVFRNGETLHHHAGRDRAWRVEQAF
jgi:hypothetical protein